MNPIRLSLMAERTSYRTDPPGTGEPEWGWEDWAHAAGASKIHFNPDKRITEVEYLALEFRWRQAGKCRHALYGALMEEALKAEQRHRWSERIDGRRYLEPMVQLALEVESRPRLDGPGPHMVPYQQRCEPCDGNGRVKRVDCKRCGGTGQLEAWKRFPGFWCETLAWMSEPTWRRIGEQRYRIIRLTLDIWVGEAIRKARPYLRDHPDD